MDFLNLPSTDRPIVAHTALGPQLGFKLKGREALSTLLNLKLNLFGTLCWMCVRC